MATKADKPGTSWRREQRGQSNSTPGTALEFREMPKYLQFQSVPQELLAPLRSIVNRYELRSGQQLPSPIAVTSPGPDAGTTMVSQALATLLAHELGKFVLWMDCRWLSAGAPYDPDQPSDLLQILADGRKLPAALHSTPDLPQLNRLSVGNVPSGQRHMIVRSNEFEQLLAILAKEFDYLIMDTPPLLGSGDGLPLLRRSGGYVMVARHRTVSVAEVRQATELASPTPNVGTVLTDYRSRIPRGLRRLMGE